MRKNSQTCGKSPVFYENKENSTATNTLRCRVVDLFPEEFLIIPLNGLNLKKILNALIWFCSGLPNSFPSGRTIDEIWDRP